MTRRERHLRQRTIVPVAVQHTNHVWHLPHTASFQTLSHEAAPTVPREALGGDVGRVA